MDTIRNCKTPNPIVRRFSHMPMRITAKPVTTCCQDAVHAAVVSTLGCQENASNNGPDPIRGQDQAQCFFTFKTQHQWGD
ncbi:MAG: hypothetical protein IH588_09105 [Anaerolineales bacterium]|nr:hypothetical protein [Anaerolineales bacterium]